MEGWLTTKEDEIWAQDYRDKLLQWKDRGDPNEAIAALILDAAKMRKELERLHSIIDKP